MNAPVGDIPSDADVAKARLAREDELQRLQFRDRMNVWRHAVADCLALARGYAEAAELGASLEDDFMLRHGIANFIAAAREAQSIYREFRPKAPWETAKSDESLHPETVNGASGKYRDKSQLRQNGEAERFTKEAVTITGKYERTIQRAEAP